MYNDEIVNSLGLALEARGREPDQFAPAVGYDGPLIPLFFILCCVQCTLGMVYPKMAQSAR